MLVATLQSDSLYTFPECCRIWRIFPPPRSIRNQNRICVHLGHTRRVWYIANRTQRKNPNHDLSLPCFSRFLSAFSQRLMTSRKKSAGFSCSSHLKPVEKQVVNSIKACVARRSHDETLVMQTLLAFCNNCLVLLRMRNVWVHQMFPG